MTHTTTELPALNMTEWLEPATKIVRSIPSIIAAYAKLKQMLPKGKGSKRDLKQLGTEIDELSKALETVCNLMSQSSKSHSQFVQAFVGLLTVLNDERLAKWLCCVNIGLENSKKHTTIVLGHEARIKVLETSMVKFKSKQDSRSAGISKTKTPKKPKK
jgi:hypothetical protein